MWRYQDTIQPQLLHGNLSGNTSNTSDGTLSGNTSGTLDDTLSGNTSDTSDGTLSGNTSGTLDYTLSGNTSDTSDMKDTSQLQQQLFDACQHGTFDDIKNMVNIDVNVRGGMGQTALFYCCISRVSPVDKIQFLVSHQADINARDMVNNTILHRACEFGTLSTVRHIVDDLHMDVNTTGFRNQTPLIYCCASSVSPVDKIQYLVSHQADINALTSINNTNLHLACNYGTLSTVEYLVDDLHMNVHTTGYNNQTPLFYCCISRVRPVDKIKYLVRHQADINARDIFNNTILHRACWFGTLSSVQYLVDCLHLDLHVKNKYGKTLLGYCRMSDTEQDEKIKYITDQMNNS